MTLFRYKKINRKPLEQSTVLLAGPIRNVSSTIDAEVSRLMTSLSGFKEAFCFLVESDSDDDTLNKLEELRLAQSNLHYLSLGSLRKTLSKRTERLAFCRNKILEEVKTNPLYINVDYIVLADMDGMNTLVTADKIAQCWSVDEDWDVVTANQVENYYDIWALRHPNWSPVDCWKQREDLAKIVGDACAENLAVTAKQFVLKPELGLIEVDSAFGGLGIYKRNTFLSGNYCGITPNGQQIAEHVPYHQELRGKGFCIYINCALTICAKYPEVFESQSQISLKFIERCYHTLGIILFGRKKYVDFIKIVHQKLP